MDIIGLVSLVLALALLGFLVWVLLTYVPMPAPFPHIIIVAVVIVLVLWLLAWLTGHATGPVLRFR